MLNMLVILLWRSSRQHVVVHGGLFLLSSPSFLPMSSHGWGRTGANLSKSNSNPPPTFGPLFHLYEGLSFYFFLLFDNGLQQHSQRMRDSHSIPKCRRGGQQISETLKVRNEIGVWLEMFFPLLFSKCRVGGQIF